MRAFARLRLPDGTTRDLAPESIIGRMTSAALCLNGPHVSEAHALVSLRGSQLRLLALRGRMSVYGKPATDVPLRPGLRIVLGGRTALEVVEVVVPEAVLAVEGEGLPRQLLGGVTSLSLAPVPTSASGFAPDADVVFWTAGDDLWARIAGADRKVAAGDALEVAGKRLSIVAVPLRDADMSETLGQVGSSRVDLQACKLEYSIVSPK